MKALLTTLNSKYTHTSLALRYLKAMVSDIPADVQLREYTINNQLDEIVRDIYKGNFQLIFFSVYIWNAQDTYWIAQNLKKVAPEIRIFMGGPEVTYDSEKILHEQPWIEAILRGEGEVVFRNLILKLVDIEKGKLPADALFEIQGLTLRHGADIVKTKKQPLLHDLDIIPFPYTDLSALPHRMLYYESSRGCPFQCQYCLSSTIKGVRYFSLTRVKKDLKLFLDEGVMQVKFIDRTFNADRRRSLEILRYIYENDNGYTNFHFEITADRLDKKTLEFLSGARPGLFQFEVGVQSTNLPTLYEVKRFVDFEKLKSACLELLSNKNIHLHLDLIAGLPYEGYERFLESFDHVYALRPHMLQLGFLKLLKGSGLRLGKDRYGYIYDERPPYEIMATKVLSFDDIIRLKGIEDMTERYYNSEKFTYSLDFALKVSNMLPSKFYGCLAAYWKKMGYDKKAHGQDAPYEILFEFYRDKNLKEIEIFEEILRFDYVRQSSRRRLYSEKQTQDLRQFSHSFLHDVSNRQKYLPHYLEQPVKQIIKKVRFEAFSIDVVGLIGSNFDESFIQNRHSTIVLFDYTPQEKSLMPSRYSVVKEEDRIRKIKNA